QTANRQPLSITISRMRIRSFFPSLLAVLLFLAGVACQLWLSGDIVWGQLEASMYVSQSNSSGLNLSCPLMLSPSESGSVSTAVTNTLTDQALPVITTIISQPSGPQTSYQTLTLDPGQTQPVHWQVGPANIVYGGHLILVNVNQGRYSDMDPRGGFCGIVIF